MLEFNDFDDVYGELLKLKDRMAKDKLPEAYDVDLSGMDDVIDHFLVKFECVGALEDRMIERHGDDWREHMREVVERYGGDAFTFGI